MKNSRLELANGDIVRLNSGSTDLKIVRVLAGLVTVEWNNELGQTQQHTLPSSCVHISNGA